MFQIVRPLYVFFFVCGSLLLCWGSGCSHPIASEPVQEEKTQRGIEKLGELEPAAESTSQEESLDASESLPESDSPPENVTTEQAADKNLPGITSCSPGETRPCAPSGLQLPVQGRCEPGIQTCSDNQVWGSCVGGKGPQAETCNGKDDDCNGWVDDIDYCVHTIAGTGQKGYKEGKGLEAQFNAPSGLVVTPTGIIYIADTVNQRIRKIDRDGIVSTYAGTGVRGSKDGPRTVAQFSNPGALALGPKGNLYVADTVNHRIRVITTDGQVSTLAGSALGLRNGKGASARFYFPSSLAVSTQGIVYVADTLNHAIRKVEKDGTVTTIAGNGDPGWSNGVGGQARFHMPIGIAVGFDGSLLIADSVNNMIRRLETNGTVSTVAGEGNRGFRNGSAFYARFYQPPGVTADSRGNIYVADAANQRIRQISPDGSVTTLAGNGRTGTRDGLSTRAELFGPTGIIMGPKRRLYFTDFNSHTVRVLQLPR